MLACVVWFLEWTSKLSYPSPGLCWHLFVWDQSLSLPLMFSSVFLCQWFLSPWLFLLKHSSSTCPSILVHSLHMTEPMKPPILHTAANTVKMQSFSEFFRTEPVLHTYVAHPSYHSHVIPLYAADIFSFHQPSFTATYIVLCTHAW